MGWAQIVMIILFSSNLVLTLVLHGQPRGGRYDFGITLIATIIQVAILHAGGFW